MSPSSLRRYRAERLLRREFEALRGRVIAAVGARLRARGAALDGHDLEVCYAQAWQGLYSATLEGREILDPFAWLVLVTFRRAIEEQRSSRSCEALAERIAGRPGGIERDRGVDDLAAELDDRLRLRRLFEGLSARLNTREREAAALCYLQGLSRAQAAAQMGLSEARMRKLMEGRGPGRPGVAGKVGALVETIRDDRWCEQQGSLMRGLAYGILDPAGERHRLAVAHRGECPACRAYVASLRGLAAALPPALLPRPAAAVLARLLAGGHAAALRRGAGQGKLAGAGAEAGRGVGSALPGAPASTAAAAGSGGALGGGWLLGGGGLVGKLAVGCVVALSLGAGCVALEHEPGRGSRRPRVLRTAVRPRAGEDAVAPDLKRGLLSSAVTAVRREPAARPLGTSTAAAREFGLERASPSAGGSGRRTGPASARSAAVVSVPPARVSSPAHSPSAAAGAPSTRSSAGGEAAAREFSPG